MQCHFANKYQKSKLHLDFDKHLNKEELDGEMPLLNERQFLQK